MFRTARALLARARAFAHDRRGNVMLLFGFSLLPITFATGMTIDYSRAMKLQTKLNAAADAAALMAVSKMGMQVTDPTSAAYLMMLMFQAQTQQYVNSGDLIITYAPPQVNATAPTNGTTGQRYATLSYRGQSKNMFGGLLKWNSLTVQGTSTAMALPKPYIDIYMALDTSQSMGLAASDADAQKLWNATKSATYNNRGCTFGCHAVAPADKYANDWVAGQVGARLRIDSLKDATGDMLNSAISNEGNQQRFNFALYRVGQTSSTIAPRSADLATMKTTVSNLTLGPNNPGGTGDTNLPDIMTYAYNNITSTSHGNGSSSGAPRAFFFLVTDGSTDLYGGGCRDGHCTKPLDPATCQALKDKGITVGIVYTTYLPVYQNYDNVSTAPSTGYRAEYTDLIYRFSDPSYTSPNPDDNSKDISPALQACASSGWFIEASDDASIQAAMGKLFNQASHAAVLTN